MNLSEASANVHTNSVKQEKHIWNELTWTTASKPPCKLVNFYILSWQLLENIWFIQYTTCTEVIIASSHPNIQILTMSRQKTHLLWPLLNHPCISQGDCSTSSNKMQVKVTLQEKSWMYKLQPKITGRTENLRWGKRTFFKDTIKRKQRKSTW